MGDYFTDIKIPNRLRDGVIVVAKGNVVCLLPEYEIADCVKVDEDTVSKAYVSVVKKENR